MFFGCAVGIFLGTLARSMPQLGLLYMLVYLPMNALSGSNTRLESVPPWLAKGMQSLRSTYFVSFAQSILYRASASTWSGRNFLLVTVTRRRDLALPIYHRTDELSLEQKQKLEKSQHRPDALEFGKCVGMSIVAR